MAARRTARERMSTLRILLVDDDEIIGMLLAEMLEDMGHEVCGIETSEAAAVRAAAKLSPDLIIIDVTLGEGSGVAAVRQILLSGPVSHLFVSGDLTAVRALMPTAAMLHKPYNEAQLVSGMQRAVAEVAP